MRRMLSTLVGRRDYQLTQILNRNGDARWAVALVARMLDSHKVGRRRSGAWIVSEVVHPTHALWHRELTLLEDAEPGVRFWAVIAVSMDPERAPVKTLELARDAVLALEATDGAALGEATAYRAVAAGLAEAIESRQRGPQA